MNKIKLYRETKHIDGKLVRDSIIIYRQSPTFGDIPKTFEVMIGEGEELIEDLKRVLQQKTPEGV